MQPGQQEDKHSCLFAMSRFKLFVGELEVDLLDTEAWYRKIKVAGDIVNFTLDTGAETYLNLNMVLSATSKRDIKLTLKH